MGTTLRRRGRAWKAAVLVGAIGAAGFTVACQPTTPTCDGLKATIVGTAGRDVISGTPNADVIVGLEGNDNIAALGGSDVVCGGPGTDELYGGAGTDRLDGGVAADRIEGGPDDDIVTYKGHSAGVFVDLGEYQGGDGDTLIDLENIIGSPHGDHLEGNDGVNAIHGLEGGDTLVGRGGADTLSDSSVSLADINHFAGGAGDDHLIGGGGDDRAAYFFSASPVHADLRANTVTGEGTDTLSSTIDGVHGSLWSDTLLGDAGRNVLTGESGNDYIVGGGGDDELDGGDGKDMASWALVTGPVFVDLAHEYSSGDGYDRVVHVEDVTGGSGSDTLRGDTGPNFIDGYFGTDTCAGGGGADTFLRCP